MLDEHGLAVFHLRYEHGLACDQETALGLLIAHCLGHGDLANADQITAGAETIAWLEEHKPNGWLLEAFQAVKQ